MAVPKNLYEGPIKLIAAPEYCPGGYSLHLYCKYENPAHSFGEFSWEITDCETYGGSVTAARQSGWIIHRDNTGSCPKCVRALRLGSPSRKPTP